MKFMSHLCKFTWHCKTVKHRYSEKSMIICQFSIIQDFKNHQLCRAMRFQPVSSMPAWLHQCWMLDQWLMNIDDKLSGGNRFKDMALHNPKEKMSMSQITLPETNCHLNSSSLPKKQHQQQGTTWNSPQKNMAKWSGFLDCVENLFSKLFINWSPWSADSPTTSKNSPIITGCFFLLQEESLTLSVEAASVVAPGGGWGWVFELPLNGVAVGDVTGGYEILKPITSVVETLGQSGGHGHVEHMSSRSVPVKSVLHYAVSEWSFKMSDCTNPRWSHKIWYQKQMSYR